MTINMNMYPHPSRLLARWRAGVEDPSTVADRFAPEHGPNADNRQKVRGIIQRRTPADIPRPRRDSRITKPGREVHPDGRTPARCRLRYSSKMWAR